MKTTIKKAMTTAPKVIEINLVDSTNKLQDFVSRITASQNNINTYRDVDILVLFAPICYLTGFVAKQRNGKRELNKFRIRTDEEGVVVCEGDLRKTWGNKNFGTICTDTTNKADAIISNAKDILYLMYTRCRKQTQDVIRDNMGLTLNDFTTCTQNLEAREKVAREKEQARQEQYRIEREAREKEWEAEREHGKKVQEASAPFVQNENKAVEDFIMYFKDECVKAGVVEGYGTIVASNNNQVVYLDEHGNYQVLDWKDVAMTHVTSDSISEMFGSLELDGEYDGGVWFEDNYYDATMQFTKDKAHVVLMVNGVTNVFEHGDFLGILKWMYNRREDIIKGGTMTYSELLEHMDSEDACVTDYAPALKEVLTVGFAFNDSKGEYHKVVYADDYGVTFQNIVCDKPKLYSSGWDEVVEQMSLPTSNRMEDRQLRFRVANGVCTVVQNESEYKNVA